MYKDRARISHSSGVKDRLKLLSFALLLTVSPLWAQGALTSASVTPSDTTAGAGALYTFDFTTSAGGIGIPANGKIRLTFPASFTDSTLVAAINVLGLSGGYSSITHSNHVVTLTRDGVGPAVGPATSVRFITAIVYNPTVADTFQIFIETLNAANAVIDTGRTALFRITPAKLHHFTVDSIGTQIAGVPFPLSVSGRDVYENLVTSFTGIVNFSANVDSVSPDTSKAFVAGVLADTVTINTAGKGRIITVKDSTGIKGSSNAFAVDAGPLHHFAVDPVATPQAAGQGFALTMTAQDSLNNTVESFVGTVNLSDSTGTVAPATSAAFVNGRRTETVTIATARLNNRLTISASGKTGLSNLFDTVSGALHHFLVTNAGGGNIATQTAGSLFSVRVTAKDANNNNVNFSGTVTLSDNSGTLSASPLVFTNQSSQTTNDVRITKARTGVIIFAGGTGLGQSNSFTVSPAALDHFRVTNTSDGNIAGQAAGTSFNIKVIAQDLYDNTVTGFNGIVSMSDQTGSLLPATSGSFAAGVLASQAVTIATSSTSTFITVQGGSPSKSGTSNNFAVSPGAVAGFTIAPVPNPQTAGSPFALVVTAVDGSGNTATSYNGTVNLSVTGGGIAPAVSGNFINGVWNGSVTIATSGANRIITATNGTFSTQSNSFAVNPAGLDHFEIASIPSQTAGSAFSVTVTAKDVFGNNVLHSGTVNLSDNTSTLTPSSLVFSNQAIQTINNAVITKAQAGVRINATDSGSGKIGQSAPFTVVHGALDHFKVTNTADGNIGNQTAAAPFNIKIVAQDLYNNTVSTFNSTVTIADQTNSITPTTSSAFAGGVLTAQQVTINNSTTSTAITVQGGSPVKSGTSNSFAVASGVLAGFTIANIPTPQTAGVPIPLVITAIDGSGNAVTSFAGTVALSVSGGGTITPATSGNFINGVWNGNVVISNSGANRVITATGATFSAQSNAFTVNPGALARFEIDLVGNQIAGAAFSVTVRAKDANGNDVSHSGTVTLRDNTNTLAASNLVFSNQTSATVSDVVITKAQSNVLITASGSGKIGQSNGFAVDPAALDHFVVTNTSGFNLATQTAGTPFNIRIVARDQFDNTVTSFNQSVTITDLTSVNATSAVFSNGVLSSQSVTVNQAKADNQLTVSGGLPVKNGASNLFNVVPGALKRFAIDNVTDQAAGQDFTITIRAVDSLNNVVTSFAGTVALTDLSNSVAPANSGAFISGVRNQSVKITQTFNNDRITVSSGSITGQSNLFNVQSSTVDHFDISNVGNQVAGNSFALTFTARDANNNVVTSFNSPVTVTDLSNSITPMTSNNFNNGALTQSFTINKSFTGNRITVTGFGKSSNSNTFNVAPDVLDHFDLAAIGDQVAGQSFPLIMTAQDRLGNTVTSFTGTVNIAINSGTITPPTSGAFVAGRRTESVTVPAAGGNRIITVSDNGGHTGTSTTFNVTASGLAKFVFSSIGTQEAGTPFSFTITAKDANNNDVTFNGTVNLSDATNTLQPTSVAMSGASVTVNNARITKAQSGVFITGTNGSVTSSSNQFNVTPAPLARVLVALGTSGPTTAADDTSLNADQVLNVHAEGFDAFNNYRGDVAVNWLVTGGIGAVNPASNSASTIFFANKVGNGRLIADHLTAIDDSSGVITVTRGAAARIKILSGTSGNTGEVLALNLTTGNFFDMHASSFDQDNNYVQDVPVSWSVNNIGTVNPASGNSTRFTAVTQGTGQVTADHATLGSDATGTITVTSGQLAEIRIVEGSAGPGAPFGNRTISTDGTLTLHAAGYDQSANYLGDFTVNWSVSNGIGSLSPASGTTVTFDPQVPNSGRIFANYQSTLIDSTGLITVTLGQPYSVKVLNGPSGNNTEVTSPTLTTGDSLIVHASSYDRDNNRIQDVNVTWVLTGNIGTLTPGFGMSTKFRAITAGQGVITADHATYQDDATGTITVRSGNLASVRILEGPAGFTPEVGNRTLTTDDVLEVHAGGFDANGNYLDDYAVDWSVSGNIGSLSAGTGKSTKLTLTRPGSGKIFANHATATDDSTGTLTISTGALYSVKILTNGSGNTLEVTNRTLTADEVLTVHAGGFDADGNYKDDYDVNWAITGVQIGTLSTAFGKTTTMEATTVGVGQITATHNNSAVQPDLTGSIQVNPGSLNSIRIVEGPSGPGAGLGNKTITADDQLPVHAAGYDADGNYRSDEPVTWSSAGTLLPVVTGSGSAITFNPTKAPANGHIRATHATAGFDTTGTITVNRGNLKYVAVLTGLVGETTPQGNATVNPGDTLRVHAGGFDADNNYRGDESVNWSLSNGIGTLSPSSGSSFTRFVGAQTGNTTIRADHPQAGVLDGNSGTISVVTGSVASVRLRTAANNGGLPFPPRTMTADQEVTIYAAGYDVGGNYVGDVNVTWTSTGNLAPPASGSGSSFTFSPTTAAADGSVQGTIVGTFSPTVSATSPTITVVPGVASGTVALTPQFGGLPADGSSTSQITSSTISDAEGNAVGAGREFTVSVTPTNLGTITTPDVNPIAAGVQVETDGQSKLNFTFRAGTTGGVATVTANSVAGGAVGSTQITLGSLSVVSVSTTPTTVSRGQAGIAASMSVQNIGSAPIQITDADLSFAGTVDRTTDYTVTPSPGNPTSIPGGSTRTFGFSVAVSSSAALETITIDGSISGTVNGTPVSSPPAGANQKDSWTVQRPAALTIVSVSSSSDTVAKGQPGVTVTVRVANNQGQSNAATALIDSVRLKFLQGPVNRNAEYVVAPNPGNPTSIAGNSAVDFSFVVNVGSAATVGQITIDAEAYGRDGNSGVVLTDLNATTPASWAVIAGNAFNITAITTSQQTVTAGMTKQWQIFMELQNTAPTTVALRLLPAQTNVRLFLGSVEVTGNYTIEQPTQLEGGGTVLAGNSTGRLIFNVTQTGSGPGLVTIAGVARGTDSGTGLEVVDDTNDFGSGQVTVQTPGTFTFTQQLAVSQAIVTAGRSKQWTVTGQVTNTGQSELQLTPGSIALNIGNGQGYSFSLPSTFVGGSTNLTAGQSKALEITINQTGTQTGTLPISLQLAGVELNSNRTVNSNTGNGTITVQSQAALNIVEVRRSRPTVTANQQTAWNVTVVVENSGGSEVAVKTDTSTNLRFRLGSQFQSGYTVSLQPATWLGTSSTTLTGGRTDSLRFVVTRTGANTGSVQLWPKIATTESNSGVEISRTDQGTQSVTVQAFPSLTYVSGSLSPKVVNNSGSYAFNLRVRNQTGAATVNLTPGTTLFRFNAGGANFAAVLDANKAIALPPGETTLTFVATEIPANIPQQTYTPTIELRGTHNLNQFSANLNTDTNELQVTAPGRVQIVRQHGSQPTVTAGMTKDWFITTTIRNNGGFAVALDSVALRLINGGDVTNDFEIVLPNNFLGSNNTTLAAGTEDSIRFEILTTGNKRGNTTVISGIWAIDQSNQERLFDESDGNNGSFVVQSQAALQITSLVPSQSTVTRGQSQDWLVDMKVSNLGESDVRIDFNAAQTFINLSLNNSDYTITPPTTLLGGGNTITGLNSATLRFTIANTGTQTGANQITGRVNGLELNSNRTLFDDTQSGGDTTVTVQTPAQLRIVSTIFTPGSAPNLPRVNTNQAFGVQVRIENLGQESVKDLVVRLTSNGGSVIEPAGGVTISTLGGTNFATAAFTITAAGNENPNEVFTANIASATAVNTNTTPQEATTLDRTESAIVQRPAGLHFVELSTSIDTVAAETTVPWFIYAVVKDTGGADVVLDPPAASNLVFRSGSQVQQDYVIEPPAGLTGGGGLVLTANRQDTLIYKVTSTGRRGNDIAITATIAGVDKNDSKRQSVQKNDQIHVITTAAVQITRTAPIVNHFFSGTSVGLVNVQQSFSVEVEVDNRGFEDVESVVVELTTSGGSAIAAAQQTIASIPLNQTRTLRFDITAADLPTTGITAETFTARIVSATASQSGGAALIFPSTDPTAQVRIQLPAELTLEISASETNLTTNQTFNLKAIVRNRENGAETGTDGRLTLNVPPDFMLESPQTNTLPFITGQEVNWQVRAPAEAKSNVLLTVSMSAIPNDRNTETQAVVKKGIDSLNVEVIKSDVRILSVTIISPSGAQDSVVSTGQKFNVMGRFTWSNDLLAGSHRVALTLPQLAGEGYEVTSAGDPQIVLARRDTVIWEIEAPPDPANPRWFRVTASAVAGDNSPANDTDSIAVTTVNRALLTFGAKMSNLGGREISELSVGQNFKIVATMRNLGVAAAVDTARFGLQLGATGITTEEPLEKVVAMQSEVVTVEWLAKAPVAPTSSDFVTINVLQRPIDENTNGDAGYDASSSGSVRLPVATGNTGRVDSVRIFLASPPGALDRELSTNQDFTIQAAVRGSRLVNVKARLLNPPEFFLIDEQELTLGAFGEDEQKTATWRLRASPTALLLQQFNVEVSGEDQNGNGSILQNAANPLVLTVVEAANLVLEGTITAPATAANGKVGLGQLFYVTANVTNLGAAQVSGNYHFEIQLPVDYATEQPLLRVTSDNFVTWQIQARLTPSPAPERITVLLLDKDEPRDFNTNLAARVSDNRVEISIETVGKNLVVSEEDLPNGGRPVGIPVARGQAGVPVLSLGLRNDDVVTASSIILNAISFRVQNRNGEEVAPNSVVKRLRIVSRGDTPRELGQLSNITATNPLSVQLATPDTIPAQSFKIADVLVDIADQASGESFSLVLQGSISIAASDVIPPFRAVAVKDVNGNTDDSFRKQSTTLVLSASDYENSFYSYPNPFSPRQGEQAKFTYNLPSDSEVEFKIYTLLGELVYEQTFSSTDPQGKSGSRVGTLSTGFILWDGNNGDGKAVLNGVYLAILKTNAGTAMTKVAVVK